MFTAVPEVSVPFAKPCERWENGTKTTHGDCSPKGLVLVHPDRRVPVVDREAGIAVAFVPFNGALPDLHMFKFREDHIELIQSVIGSRGATSTGWPDDKSMSRRVPLPRGAAVAAAEADRTRVDWIGTTVSPGLHAPRTFYLMI
jgi:hypothetical protein